MDFSIGFIGGGNMAAAIVRGLVAAGVAPRQISVTDPQPAARERIHAIGDGIAAGTDNATVAASADVLVLAVKPQALADVCATLAPARKPGQLVVSIAAGVRLASLAAWLGADTPLVRAMPNQPALVGAGITALVAPASVTPADRARAAAVLEAAGPVVWLDDESLMDAVTAVSGSGPAYFYLLTELLAAAGQAVGLPPALAATLARQTAFGAGRTLAETDQEAAALRAAVTSPGGTTAAALAEFERAGLAAIVTRAVTAARDRGVELGRPAGH
ncbi:MAG: pyrroline-5-carboxylate reductase [Chromatiales bacterium]|nr:pyrroline-5-carboxylate reductase [Chromatiales bacterium]